MQKLWFKSYRIFYSQTVMLFIVKTVVSYPEKYLGIWEMYIEQFLLLRKLKKGKEFLKLTF